jgi:hypothetical protein
VEAQVERAGRALRVGASARPRRLVLERIDHDAAKSPKGD